MCVGILIHTSVKLVTRRPYRGSRRYIDFNPHEREARDHAQNAPQETPADFNPHEREARDLFYCMSYNLSNILIHTSVKLVTESVEDGAQFFLILIHTSVKLVTREVK